MITRIISILVALILVGSPAGAEPWKPQPYAAYEIMVLRAAERLREAVIRYRVPLGLEARIAEHRIIVAARGDPECADPTNFAYYDLDGHIVMCTGSFTDFFDLQVELLKLGSVRKGLIGPDDINDYAEQVAQFYLARQSGRTIAIGHCPAEYWVFLVRNQLPRKACFAETVLYGAEFAAFLQQGGIYGDVTEAWLDQMRVAGIDIANLDLSYLTRFKGKSPEEQVKMLYQDAFQDFYRGSVSSIYFHELGHFYLGHGKEGVCAVGIEENAAEKFSQRLMKAFSPEGPYNAVPIGDPYYLNIYYYVYFKELAARFADFEEMQRAGHTIAELPSEARSLGIVRIAAALQSVFDDARLRAAVEKSTGEPADAEDLRSSIADFMEYRGCKPARR